jgi:hypothetical protein
MVVCQVFIAEIRRLRSLRAGRATQFPARDEAQLRTSTQLVMSTMAMFGGDCPVISELLSSDDAY